MDNTGFAGKLSPDRGAATKQSLQCSAMSVSVPHYLLFTGSPVQIARVGPGFRSYTHPSQVSGTMRNYSGGLCL